MDVNITSDITDSPWLVVRVSYSVQSTVILSVTDSTQDSSLLGTSRWPNELQSFDHETHLLKRWSWSPVQCMVDSYDAKLTKQHVLWHCHFWPKVYVQHLFSLAHSLIVGRSQPFLQLHKDSPHLWWTGEFDLDRERDLLLWWEWYRGGVRLL